MEDVLGDLEDVDVELTDEKMLWYLGYANDVMLV